MALAERSWTICSDPSTMMTESRLQLQFGTRTLLIAFVWVGLCLHAVVHWSTYGPLMLLILVTAAAATRFSWRGGLCLSFWVTCFVVDCFEFNQGSIVYFSPDSLRSKSIREVLIPELPGDIHLYRAQPVEFDDALAEHLVTRGYWQRRKTDDGGWVFTAHYNRRWKDGQTSWKKVVAWRSDKWIQWTEDNPKLAADVWPRILKVLRQESPFDQSTEIAAGILDAVWRINDVRELDAELATQFELLDAWERSGE
ncbi:MAG: hypothetical protein JNM18_10890 [Planctomycetaceae bacterium]|nr:hypothetical protein [Planctomycetaceae bacterium]